VRARTQQGEPIELELHEFAATVFQHEFDHLDGKLYIDRITDSTKLAFEEEFGRYLIEQPDDDPSVDSETD
jgi:peptide deformylase